ncbi:MAG: LysM peptidoglycan-binding domain-containing protein [Syntrophales bacterium]|nr:LysM peptidoglycan-binding domain-containing protein [Syntrophales bacterium]
MFILKRLIITIFLVLFLSSCVPQYGSVRVSPPDLMEKVPVVRTDESPQASQVGSNSNPAQDDISGNAASSDTETSNQEEVNEKDDALDDSVSSDAETSNQEEVNGKNHGQNNKQAIMDEALAFLEQSQLLWEKGEPDNALKLLDEAYSLVLYANGDPEIAWQKDDLRVMIAKKIVEIYTCRSHVAAGYQSAIPLVMNEDVEAAIKRFQNNERDFFISSYSRAGRHRPMILRQLKEAGLPEELSWLPLVESGFKIKALSKARALGLWQIIPSTGYRYGLKRDLWIDERMDPEKSTRAAIAYLKELHEIFGDWLTVLAAYNCGEGRVLKTISRQQMNYLDNFWDLYRQLPLETSNYVPRFLATVQIMKDPKKYGIDLNLDRDKPLPFYTVKTEKSVSLKDVAQMLEVSEEILNFLNPELRYKTTPSTYELKIPAGMEGKFALIIDKVSEAKKPGAAARYVNYRVKRGDTISDLARRYKSSVNAILAANHLTSKHNIREGIWIKIPSQGYDLYADTRQSSPVSKGGAVTAYSVKRGDSLWLIAKRFGTTISEVRALNGLQSNTLSIGQIIKVRGGAADRKTKAVSSKTCVVGKGDTLSTIALRNKIGLDRLLDLNNLARNSIIRPGQRIRIK